MVDKYMLNFIENGLASGMIKDLKHYSRPNIICTQLRILRNLASQRDCRAYLLKFNCFEKAMQFLEFDSDEIKLEAMRLLSALQ